MQSKIIENIDNYVKYINNNSISINFTENSKLIYESNILELHDYSNKQSLNRCFLIIPSIINGPEIMFLNYSENIIKFLQNKGRLLLIKWKNVNQENKFCCLDDYVEEIINIFKYLKLQKIELIGHCLGGNIAVAAASQMVNAIKNVTLLTMIWDFSYYKKYTNLFNLEIFKEYVPAIALELMFFFHDINSVFKKFGNESFTIKENFLMTEKWLHSGNNMTLESFRQIKEDFIEGDILMNNKWKKLNLENIKKLNFFIVYCKHDKIAPKNSIAPLIKLLRNPQVLELDSGHIGFLLGKDSEKFYNFYEKWLEEY